MNGVRNTGKSVFRCGLALGWAGSGLVLGAGVMAGVVAAAEAPDRRGEEVVVIYNLAGGDDSARVARHYAEVRHVPDPQVIGLSLPTGETLTRANFDERLRRPLMKELVERGLVQVAGPEGRGTAGTPGQVSNVIQETAIRYLVLCYGVPLKIAPDPSLVRPGQEKLAAPMRRNEAAVDSELAGLAQIESGVPLAGPMTNPLAGATDPAQLHPRNGVFMVARLDGPTAEIAMGLVDKAVQAEEKGLWGRAWFDLRGLNGGGYQVGDDWIRAASEVARRAGYETVVDRAGPVFPEGFPMPQIALYAGWYAGSVSGPFKSANVEFMPGAVAYHLHSFSARTLKSTGTAWVGPLLDRGVTATFGCVYEPYLKGTPNVGIFFDRLLDRGFTFGEAIYAAQGTLSWQTTVVGDPLYCPMLHSIEEFKVQLAGKPSEAAQWLILQDLNHRLSQGLDAGSAVEELEAQPLANGSAILQQKLAELHAGLRHRNEAVVACRRALDSGPSPEQKAHLQLALARYCTAANREKDAVEAYEQFFADHPDRPGLLAIYEEALPIAKSAGRRDSAGNFAREIERLKPPPPEVETPPEQQQEG